MTAIAVVSLPCARFLLRHAARCRGNSDPELPKDHNNFSQIMVAATISSKKSSKWAHS
jgi:hypothetical protein